MKFFRGMRIVQVVSKPGCARTQHEHPDEKQSLQSVGTICPWLLLPFLLPICLYLEDLSFSNKFYAPFSINNVLWFGPVEGKSLGI